MKKLRVFVFSFMVTLCLGGCNHRAASIGIIGGADGPTAVFIASKVNWPSIYRLLGAIIMTVLVVLLIYRNKKKK